MTTPGPKPEIRDWLNGLGLGAHAASFAANGIDWDVLGDLREGDLKELGLSLGDRKRLLRAITDIANTARNDTQAPAPTVATPNAPQTPAEAERRHVSVMFADLVGSTPLAERLDPEEMRQVLHAFHRAAAAAIEAHDGHLATFLGDGILAYFGYPVAHEDDAVRAVRAGLEMIAAIAGASTEIDQRHGVTLRLRVGIHTGLVVAGEIGAGATRDDRAIVGETPNVAARLQAIAAPDTLVIGATTQRQVEGLFLFEDLGAHALKGIARPMRLYRVLAESRAAGRFDARAMRGLTPLVGRAAELEMLRQRWQQACDGEMRCVLLVGDPGIGKSRTLRAFRDAIADEPHGRITLHASPYHVNSTLWPVLERIRGTLGRDGAGEIGALERFAAELGPLVVAAIPVLAGFLGIDTAGRHAAIDPTSLLFKQRLLDALVGVAAAMAARAPLLMVVEDAHWVDPSTLEFLRLVQERLTTARLLLLVTARPEFKPGWEFAHVLQINLDRLSRRDRVTLVEGVTAGKRLPAAVLDQIVARTDGVPLFVEELTRTLLESGHLRDAGDRWELGEGDISIAIPDTLQGSLLARLDRLDPEAKEIAQIGAVIGREFRRELLALVAGRDGAALDAALTRLVEAAIVVPSASGGLLFRHALIQDAAYQSLLMARRARYHATIADAIERHFADTVESQPEILAQHLTAAARPERAIAYWLRAGRRNVDRNGFAEAVAQLKRGLQQVEALPETEGVRAEASLSLLLQLGRAEVEVVGAPAAETFRRAVAIARAGMPPAALAQAALAYEEGHRVLGASRADAVPLLEEALAALGDGESLDHCRVLCRLARACVQSGNVERAAVLNAVALPLARRLGDQRGLMDALACEVTSWLGRPVAADGIAARRALLDEYVGVTEALGSLVLLVEALHYQVPFSLELGEFATFGTALDRFVRLTETGQSELRRAVATGGLAMQAILAGEFAAAEKHADAALAHAGATHTELWQGVYGLQIFTIRREQGRLAEIAPLLRRVMDVGQSEATWRPGLMVIASDLGFVKEARNAFDRLAAAGFDFPRDGKYLLTLSYLAETCTRLRDRERAAQLYDLLWPFRDMAIVVPSTTVCIGAAARHIGLLATILERWDAAAAHFQSALDLNSKLEAPPFVAHVQAEYADMLIARGRDGDAAHAKGLRVAARETASRLGMRRLADDLRRGTTHDRASPPVGA